MLHPSWQVGKAFHRYFFLFGLFIYNWLARKAKNYAAGHGYDRNRSIKSCQEAATVEPQREEKHCTV